MTVPYDRPLTQFRSCGLDSHPEIPPVRVFKNIQPAIKHAVVLLVNTCSDDCNRTRNALRTLYYNHMSANGWKNPVFLEAVELSLNIAFLFITKRKFNTDEDSLRAAVKNVNTMLASKLAMEHPTIVRDIPPHIQEDVKANVGQLINIKKEIAACMNSDGSYNQQQWSSGDSWGNGSSDGWGKSTSSSWGQSNSSGWTTGDSQSTSSWGQSSSSGWSDSSSSDGWGGSFQQNKPELNPAELSLQRYTTPPPPPPAPAPAPALPAPVKTPPPSPVSKNAMTPLITDTTKALNEMDRAKHKIIVLGQETSGAQAYEGWRSATAELSSASVKASSSGTYLHPKLLSESTLDNTIAYAKMHALASMPESNIYTPYRVFGVYLDRITTMHDQGDTWMQLKNCSSLAELSLRLGNFAKAAVSSLTSERGRRAHLAFLHAVNNWFTREVNYWLQNRTGLGGKVKIDSFMDDWKPLIDLLDRKYTQVSEAVNSTFEDPVISLLESSSNLEEKLREASIIGADCPENLYEYFIPSSCSVTYLPMLQRELGYKLNEISLVEPEKFPVLWDTINSLQRHSKEMGMRPLRDVIVLADGETYHVSACVTRRGENYIFKP